MTKFDFPHTQETVTWILQNLNKRWRDWKGDLKAEFYIPKAKEQVLVAPPSIVLEEQWPGLVRQWYNPRNEELAEIYKRNAKKQNNAHTFGRKSFARIRNEMETETGKEPDRLTMWDATHKKIDGSYVNEEFRKKLVSSLPYIILSLYYYIFSIGCS
ncbi:putative transposase, Ptta/En/Spm, plant [Dioscorea sansibarensis]